VVSVLATVPKDSGFKPGRGDGFLRAHTVLRWKVKPEAPCRKILQHATDPLMYLKY
jgi:hypothetical protein